MNTPPSTEASLLAQNTFPPQRICLLVVSRSWNDRKYYEVRRARRRKKDNRQKSNSRRH